MADNLEKYGVEWVSIGWDKARRDFMSAEQANKSLGAELKRQEQQSQKTGKSLDSVRGGTWLLVDLAAFIADPKIPKPSKYLILYANGRSVATATLPADIVKTVAEAREKAAEKK